MDPRMNGKHEVDDEINEDDIEIIYDDDDDNYIDDDEDGKDGTDQGDMADIEDEGEDNDFDDEVESFAGEKPHIILKGHQENAVFCCAFDTAGEKLITGGEDDAANVWDASSIETNSPICKCRGHKDSVISVGFNFDSTYFSSADLSGVVKVWKTSEMTATPQPVLSLETSDLTWSFWHFAANVLFAGCEDGSIYMWKVPSGECKIFSSGGSKCECATLLSDGKRLVAGYEDGTVRLFDLKTGQVEHVLQASSRRSCAILSIDKSSTHQIIVTGDFRGQVKVYNTQTGKHLQTLQCAPVNVGNNSADEDGNADSVECVAFWADKGMEYIAAGTVSGHIVIWDVPNLAERVRFKQEAGLAKIVWDPKAPTLYTAGLDGIIRIIDARSGKIEKTLGRHRAEVLDLAVSKDGTKLVSASEDGTTFLFNL